MLAEVWVTTDVVDDVFDDMNRESLVLEVLDSSLTDPLAYRLYSRVTIESRRLMQTSTRHSTIGVVTLDGCGEW